MFFRFKVTNILLFVLSILVLCNFFLPYSNLLFTGGSFYQPGIGFIYCRDKSECRHEVGHLMDDDLGNISKSEEFGMVITLYLYYQIKHEELNGLGKLIFGMPGMIVYSKEYEPYQIEAGSSPQQELYARIYAYVDGDISKLPQILRKFYSNEEKYDKIYQYIVVNKYYLKTQGDTQ